MSILSVARFAGRAPSPRTPVLWKDRPTKPRYPVTASGKRKPIQGTTVLRHVKGLFLASSTR